ncbi:hypothetical protein [Nocardioides lijunqiniae]|uniref:hypothetical protein n=1 Tax=Nocardioides lijunqiniae TaxID=2760832 RepID=UPI001877EE29|nr:hypothetical protein [Nocardioides lijunqiniae]
MDTHDDPIRTALGAHLGDDVAERLLTRIDRYSNLPNTVKGTAKTEGAPEVERAALVVVEDPALAGALGLEATPDLGPYPTQELWGLLTLAARADVEVLNRLAEGLGDQEYARRLQATIRRAAAKHAAAPTDGPERPASQAPDVPQKVSEVKAWLAAHPDADPALLAPREGQRAAERSAAVRALGTIGTPGALDVLGRYAEESYPDAVLKELHRAWGRFDRREFAARMFRQAPYTLSLGLAPTLEGIGAVAGLTSLEVVLTGGADLAPLAECTGLRTLRVGAEGEPGLLGVGPLRDLPELTELHLTRTTRNADLTALSGVGARRLRIDLEDADGSFLLDMPRLESLLVGGEREDLAGVVLALVRRGVRVAAYRHQRSWVTGLREQAEAAADVHLVETNGYLGLTSEESAVDDVRRQLYLNLLP